MKKGLKVVLIVFALILTLLGGICIWQRNNIVAIYKTFVSTPDELQKELNDNKQNLESELEKKYSAIVGDFSAEDEKKILEGKISVEQAVADLNQRYEEKKNSIKPQNPSKVNSKEIDKLVSDKVVELYSVKAYYLGQLGQLEDNVRREYDALPKEKRNMLNKQNLVSKYMGVAAGLLNQCDAQVDKLLSELEADIKRLDGDTSIIKTLKNAYENEKALKKARYMKMLN